MNLLLVENTKITDKKIYFLNKTKTKIVIRIIIIKNLNFNAIFILATITKHHTFSLVKQTINDDDDGYIIKIELNSMIEIEWK